MAPTSAGLTNGGQTTHYQFTYDNSLGGPGGIEPARTNQVLANCEADFNLMSGWFNNIALDVNFRIPVNVTQNSGGASWNLSGGNLTVTINPGTGNQGFAASQLVRILSSPADLLAHLEPHIRVQEWDAVEQLARSCGQLGEGFLH